MSQNAEEVLTPAQMTPLVLDLVRSVTRHDETLDVVKTQLESIDARMTDFQTQLGVVNGHLGGMDRRMSKIEESQRRVDLKVAELRLDTSAGFEGIQNRLATLETKHDGFATATTARFDALDKRFETVDERFDEVDERFDEVDERFDKVEDQFKLVDQRFVEVDARLRTMDAKFEAKFDKVDERFEQVDQRFVEMDARLKTMDAKFEAKFDKVDQRFVEMDARLKTMDAKFEAKFDKVDERFDKVEGRLTTIEGHLAAIARAVNADLPPEAGTAGLAC